MGQMKKVIQLLKKYDSLPDGDFKQSVSSDMEKIRETVVEISDYQKKLSIVKKRLKESKNDTHTNG